MPFRLFRALPLLVLAVSARVGADAWESPAKVYVTDTGAFQSEALENLHLAKDEFLRRLQRKTARYHAKSAAHYQDVVLSDLFRMPSLGGSFIAESKRSYPFATYRSLLPEDQKRLTKRITKVLYSLEYQQENFGTFRFWHPIDAARFCRLMTMKYLLGAQELEKRLLVEAVAPPLLAVLRPHDRRKVDRDRLFRTPVIDLSCGKEHFAVHLRWDAQTTFYVPERIEWVTWKGLRETPKSLPAKPPRSAK